ncbi:hypothetical protein DYB25_010353 [Aphanomyces astaci]|uniref:Methyltransferase type 11 domain-containing protein n=2 Tax=Aphanomyces astaci TaxID=112090 RepID=A0A397DTJ3_APHAT|nr:hypothetical protein DYB25_010353 [Aphanomyces astaci]RHY67189.1 hypothetical protein DYB38_012282 [Aphanomyces astaci]RHY68602.1 hypothetical protein DYB30_003937 [Aphanomyces astaci]RHY84380.1 hypothetical protein DYB26_011920 [Aphanomyces astaci]
MVASRVHAVARAGFVNGSLYEKARPDFPREALVHLIPPSLSRSSRVLDVGSGTGKFTSLLASHFDSLVAVEPSESMRTEFKARHPSITCVDGTAEHLPFPDASQDAIYLAQTFHWCANAAALHDMSRVLTSNGFLGLIWNLEDDRTSWVRDLRAIYEQFDVVAPQYRTGQWELAFRSNEHAFEYPLQHIRLERLVPVDTTDHVWLRVLSKSYIHSQPQDVIDSVKAEVDAILDTATFERDGSGRILYPYVTDMYWTHKK